MTLNSSQTAQLKEIWRILEPDELTHGAEVLIKMFERYPETKAFFKRIDCSSSDQMRGSIRFRAHSARIFHALGLIMDSLDNPEMTDDIIFLLGENHNHRSMVPSDFTKYFNVLIDYLKFTLGARYPATAEQATRELQQIFCKKMGQHLAGALTLDSYEIDQLKAVWRLLAPDQLTHGVEILIKLFERYPETKAFFARLDTSSNDGMRRSTRFRAHSGRIIGAWGGLVKNLENQQMFDEMIFLLGENHNRRHMVPADFRKFTNVLIDYLKWSQGAKYPPSAEAATKKMMDMFVKRLGQQLE